MAIYIPDFEEILPVLNMDAVGDAILKPKRDGQPPPRYTEDEFENIKEMIWAAAKKWLPRDLVDFQITSVEDKTIMAIGDTEIKAYLDVLGELKGNIKPFDEYAGKIMIVDWKTRDGELDTRWRHKLIDSWQWKIYAAMSGATIFNYRGVSRRCYEECATKEIILAVPHTVYEEVFNQCWALIRMRETLIQLGKDVWPRNMPDACRTGTAWECPFKVDCDNYSMPRFIPENKVMSYTEFHRFLQCPELSRRMQMEPEADETEASNIGSGFHSGMAELYRQAKIIKL